MIHGVWDKDTEKCCLDWNSNSPKRKNGPSFIDNWVVIDMPRCWMQSLSCGNTSRACFCNFFSVHGKPKRIFTELSAIIKDGYMSWYIAIFTKCLLLCFCRVRNHDIPWFGVLLKFALWRELVAGEEGQVLSLARNRQWTNWCIYPVQVLFHVSHGGLPIFQLY